MKKETIRARKSSWKVRDCQMKTNFSKRLKKKTSRLQKREMEDERKVKKYRDQSRKMNESESKRKMNT